MTFPINETANPSSKVPRHKLPGNLVPVSAITQYNMKDYADRIGVRGKVIPKAGKPSQLRTVLNDGISNASPRDVRLRLLNVRSRFGIGPDKVDPGKRQTFSLTAYLNDNDPILGEAFRIFAERGVRLLTETSMEWSKNKQQLSEDVVRNATWPVVKISDNAEAAAKYGEFLRFSIYEDNVTVTVNWKEHKMVDHINADGSVTKIPKSFTFQDVCDMTQKYPGKPGTYTLEIEAPYFHILNGKAGYKTRILTLNYNPDDEATKNPFFANIDEMQDLIPPMDKEGEEENSQFVAPAPPADSLAGSINKKRSRPETEGEAEGGANQSEQGETDENVVKKHRAEGEPIQV